MPYVTYNLFSSCTVGRQGQRFPWAKVAMGTTSGCSALCSARTSQGGIIRDFFMSGPKFFCSISSLCAVQFPLPLLPLSSQTHLHTDTHTHTRWAIWILAFMPTHPSRLHIGLLCNQFEILYNQIHKITFFFYFGESARMNVI